MMNQERRPKARMVPVFGKNHPSRDTVRSEALRNGNIEEEAKDDDAVMIGLRMPYDLPLTPYAPGEMPWSPQGTYMTPDSRGGVWEGY